MTPIENSVAKTIEFLKIPAVVGFETPFLNYLENQFNSLNLNTRRYPNLLYVAGSSPNSNILSIHIDRHGLIANGKGELEYAAFRVKHDKYNRAATMSKTLWKKIKDRFIDENVYAYDAKTGNKISKGKIASCYVCPLRENFVFKVEALKDLPKDTPVSFDCTCTNNNQNLSGQLDNVLSVAVIYELFKNGFQGAALFTTEEEIGNSWSHIIDFFKTTNSTYERLLVLDTSPFKETDSLLFNEIILRNRDNNGLFHEEVTKDLKNKCLELQIPYILKDEFIAKNSEQMPVNLGSTELGRIISESSGKITGTTIQIPTTGYHSNKETVTMMAVDNYYNFLFSILNKKLI